MIERQDLEEHVDIGSNNTHRHEILNPGF